MSKTKMSLIFHLDLDSFFVSVERILDPTLIGKPVIVGADPHKGRGVVAACSYEARHYGVHSGMPITQAYKLCPQGIYLHGHPAEYERFSNAVRRLLEKFTPQIEQASVDEFYMDFSGMKRIYVSPLELAEKLQREVWQKLFLPASIGIGSNKTIAKIGSVYAKPKGIMYVPQGMEKEFLAPLSVEVIPGVGKVMKKKLNERGFYLVKEVAKVPAEYFAVAFGKTGEELWRKANGQGSEFVTLNTSRKSISKEHTYQKNTANVNEIKRTLFELTGLLCESLRNEGLQASKIGIKLRYSDFVTITRDRKTLPTDDDRIVFQVAAELFGKAFTRRVGIRLIGIKLTDFVESVEQLTLFDKQKSARQRLLRTVTKLRKKFGYSAIRIGTFDSKRK